MTDDGDSAVDDPSKYVQTMYRMRPETAVPRGALVYVSVVVAVVEVEPVTPIICPTGAPPPPEAERKSCAAA